MLSSHNFETSSQLYKKYSIWHGIVNEECQSSSLSIIKLYVQHQFSMY